ncbi:glycerate kinase [Nocardioides euryhalodurans]|uniref:Glycerate kinase n=1 Tax=Nocardioides euryhalodurans TaxID=2518370 RepID=A0A4P7GKL1_9ACTN|nr:glycerate kinase [Nocardioides euryhalodurans]QBR92304.1 glycerate kinase [Nocardioides euryhalodurans]
MSGAPRVLLAPDKFKGSLAASGVADAVGRGIRSVLPGVEVVALPVADGGDGTLDAALAAGFDRVPVTVAGPTGEPVATAYARRGSVAVVEMADACGLVRLPGDIPAPLTASSAGLGEVVRAALDAGCDELVLGIGGSASTDGGAGMLAALGVRLLDDEGNALPAGGGALADLASVDLSGLHPAAEKARFVVACDVDNPLLGPKGAAAVYGPQKGASPDEVASLDDALERLADVVASALGADHRAEAGAGAAGGVGFAALALLDATLRPGIDLMLDLVGFDAHVPGSTLVVTGEGALDAQSLHGKAPVGVARRAVAAGVPVVAVCGHRALGAEELRAAGIGAAYALLDLEPDVETCIREPAPLLARLGEQIAHEHLS